MDESKNILKPSIFEYDDYRHFLRDLYAFNKAEKPQFSFRYFSRLAGFQSPNFLKLVIDGQRNLSKEGAEKFAKGLKLQKAESAFFKNLVFYNQTTDFVEKDNFAGLLMNARSFQKFYPLAKAEHHYYRHWFYVALREMVVLEDFKEDPRWISRRLNPSVPVDEVVTGIQSLLDLKMLTRDASGKLSLNFSTVVSTNSIPSFILKQFHKEMIQKGSESMDRFPSELREINAATISVRADQVQLLKEKIRIFRDEILAMTESNERKTEVYQLNIQFFPLTEKDSK